MSVSKSPEGALLGGLGIEVRDSPAVAAGNFISVRRADRRRVLGAAHVYEEARILEMHDLSC